LHVEPGGAEDARLHAELALGGAQRLQAGVRSGVAGHAADHVAGGLGLVGALGHAHHHHERGDLVEDGVHHQGAGAAAVANSVQLGGLGAVAGNEHRGVEGERLVLAAGEGGGGDRLSDAAAVGAGAVGGADQVERIEGGDHLGGGAEDGSVDVGGQADGDGVADGGRVQRLADVARVDQGDGDQVTGQPGGRRGNGNGVVVGSRPQYGAGCERRLGVGCGDDDADHGAVDGADGAGPFGHLDDAGAVMVVWHGFSPCGRVRRSPHSVRVAALRPKAGGL
jgi:hypothetical protein